VLIHSTDLKDVERGSECLLLILAIGLFLFGSNALSAGLHLDDHVFHRTLAHASWPAVRTAFVRYVAGRNLYILYYAGLYRLLGDDPARLHLAGLLLDLLNVGLFWVLMSKLRLPAAWKAAACGLFLVYPNHVETHYWTSAIAMNLLSTALLFGAWICALSRGLSWTARAGGAIALFAAALFDYDQIFFMWIPLVVALALQGQPRRRLVALGGMFAGLDLVHFLVRIYDPFSDGGRPMIRLVGIPKQIVYSLWVTLVPIRKLPSWQFLSSPLGSPAITVVAIGVAAAVWIWLVVRRWPRDWSPQFGQGAYGVIALGVVWYFCAYLPNYFWYISPRSNYLPSAGLLLAVTPAVALFVARRPLVRRGVCVAAFLLFGMSAAVNMAGGRGWRDSTLLLDTFGNQARPMLRSDSPALFVLDAPHEIEGAPFFDHPAEHLNILVEKGSGSQIHDGDVDLLPTANGFFYSNDTFYFGDETFRWMPSGGTQIIGFDGRGFNCVDRLVLAIPGGGSQTVNVGQAPDCRSVRRAAPVWLAESSDQPTPSGVPLFAASNGARLLGIETSPGPSEDTLDLAWIWTAAQDPGPFAVTVDLRADGVSLYRSLCPSENFDRTLVCPLFDDSMPPSWPREGARRLVFRVRAPAVLADRRLSARFAVFEESADGIWTKIGAGEAPVMRR
jgi:hypothetical protein